MTPQQAARYQTPTPGNLRAAYSGGPASLAGWLIARLVMTIGTHQSDHTLSEKAEASFEESDPQRLMKRPITRSCMVVVLEKQIVRRTRRLIRVHRLMCLLSGF